MADQPQPATINATYPAPPPFYKSFTSENLQRQKDYLESIDYPTSQPLPNSTSRPDILSLPPEIRHLFPPAPPSDGKYRSFGEDLDISPSSLDEDQIQPTPSRLQALTRNLLLSFLKLTHLLATNPGAYAPTWGALEAGFKEVHKILNGYRPHQARETLIVMMEEQIRKVREETKAVRESMGRAREVLESIGKTPESEGLEGSMIASDDQTDARAGVDAQRDLDRRKTTESGDRRVWEVLATEVGTI